MNLKLIGHGALLWLSSLQYYVVQIVVASGWSQSQGYSWGGHTISDLANTACGGYGDRLVCSPGHVLMGVSFIVLGITMASGAVLLARQLTPTGRAKYGFYCLVIAGVGTVLVGLFPENSNSLLHAGGAALPFVLGNLGMIIIGTSLERLPTGLGIYSIASGFLGLIALGCFLSSTYLGLGIGGMERIAAYPQSIWMIILGAYLLKNNSTLKTHQ